MFKIRITTVILAHKGLEVQRILLHYVRIVPNKFIVLEYNYAEIVNIVINLSSFFCRKVYERCLTFFSLAAEIRR